MTVRLGEFLIERGVLTKEQVESILQAQQEQHKPFGLLCEELCGVSPEAIEDAWAKQYATITRTIDPSIEVYEDRAKELITPRQAWQFRVLPIRFDDNELMIATTQEHLRRALRFANNVLGVPLYFVMTTPDALGEALCKHYKLPGMTAQSIGNPEFNVLRSAG
jgi:hypothetical protein